MNLEGHRVTLANCKSEYGYLNQVFQMLDTKAQVTVGTSGIFLAATFAFVQSLESGLGRLYISILAASVLLLLLTIVLALCSMWLQRTPGHPSSDLAYRLLEDIVNTDGTSASESHTSGFYGDQIRAWMFSIGHLHDIVERKSRYLEGAQRVLLLSIVSIALLTILYLLNGVKP